MGKISGSNKISRVIVEPDATVAAQKYKCSEMLTGNGLKPCLVWINIG